MKELKHFTPDYLLNPTHPVSILLCGVGGTGSQVLTGLARIDYALRKLGHPGFNVTAYDGDQVSEANIGRQLFSESDIGQNKATILIGRINRFFGQRWLAQPKHLSTDMDAQERTNFLITCVDTVKARRDCVAAFKKLQKNSHPYTQQYYWLDYGNTKNTGQIVLGTFEETKQPKGRKYTTVGKLPTLLEMYPDLEDDEATLREEPSCSVMEALSRQDLMINTILANLGTDMLFRMFREGGLQHQGIFYNGPEILIAKIPLPAPLPDSKQVKKPAKKAAKANLQTLIAPPDRACAAIVSSLIV